MCSDLPSSSPTLSSVSSKVCYATCLAVDSLSLEHGLDRSQCLFVGDAITDFQAASSTSLPFLGIVPTGYASPFPDHITTSSSVSDGLRAISTLMSLDI